MAAPKKVTYRRLTLQEFGFFIQSLPANIRAKPIAWIDISHVTAEDLNDIRARLMRQDPGDDIEMSS
jgi:hypothetical protein